MLKLGKGKDTGVTLIAALKLEDRPIWGPELIHYEISDDNLESKNGDKFCFFVEPENWDLMNFLREMRTMGLEVDLKVAMW